MKMSVQALISGHRWKACGYVFWAAVALMAMALNPGTAGASNATTTTLYIGKHYEVREYDAPVKYVFNGNTRVARATGSLAASSRVQRFRLYHGWNLLSLAVSAGDVLYQITNAQPLIVSAQSIFSWNESNFAWEPLTPGRNLSAGAVLWLKSGSDASLTLRGTYTAPANRSVTPAGSFVPSAGLDAWDIRGAISNAPSASAWTYDSAASDWLLPWPSLFPAQSGFPLVLAPGAAVFVREAAPAELAVPDPALRIRYYHQDHLGSSSVVSDAGGAIIEEAAYYPFGANRHAFAPRQVAEPYGFGEKERDRESGLQYFEARYLGASIARFITPDSKYLESDRLSTNDLAAFLANPQLLNLHNYVLNNPLRWIDQTGFSPGDPFKTPEKAATDALIAANPKSIVANREYGGLIYYDPLLKRYYATTPTTGTGASFNPSSVSIPAGTKKVGDYHTHGDYTFMLQMPTVQVDPRGNLVQTTLNIPFHGPKATDFYDSEHFSGQDLTGIAADATGIRGYKGYLGTPSGNFQQYDPATTTVSPLSTTEPEKDPTNCKGNYTGTFPYFQVSCE